MLVQERLHNCRAGEQTHTFQPILPQSPNYLGASWVCGHLWHSGCQNLYTGRGLQNCGGKSKGAKTGRTIPFRKCRGRFSRTYSPASQCPCRHQRWTPLAPPDWHSSLTDLSGTTSILQTNWHHGLPLRLSELPRGEGSTQGRSEAICCGGSTSWAKRTSWDLPCHRQTCITLSFRKLWQQSQTLCAITVWASPIHMPGVVVPLSTMCCFRFGQLSREQLTA